MGRALRGRGGQLGGPRGSGYRGGMLGVLPEDVSNFFGEWFRVNHASWSHLLTNAKNMGQFKTLPEVSSCEVNHKPLFLKLGASVGFVFTSSRTTGLFDFHPFCSTVDNVLQELYAGKYQESANEIRQVAKIWPPFVGWENLKKHCLADEQKHKILRSRSVYDTKRCFFRYGIPVPGTESRRAFLLAPFGAYDEPNNRHHFDDLTAPSDASDYDRMWHESAVQMHKLLLLTTDVIDVLMQKYPEDKYWDEQSRRMVVLLSNIIAVDPSTGMSVDLEPCRLSTDFSNAFCSGIQPPASSFCQKQLLWTFPDSNGLEAFSAGNLSGDFQNHSLYESCLKKDGVKEHVLNQTFLEALQKEYDGLEQSDQLKIKRSEPSFFKLGKVRVPKTEKDIDMFYYFFVKILHDRLYQDAFSTTPAKPDYYTKLTPRFTEIKEFTSVLDSRFDTIRPKNTVQIPFKQVTGRAGAGPNEAYAQAFMRFYQTETEELPIDSADPSSASSGSHDGPEVPGEPPAPPDVLDPPQDPPRPYVAPDGHGRRRVRPLVPDPDDADYYPEDSYHRRRPEHADDGGVDWSRRREPDAGYDDGRDRYNYGPPEEPVGYDNPEVREMAKNIEIVVLRPNIEHYMLGIIMGLAGEQLGNTLWGQTELSVYDDSMHGVWGMSYK